MKFINQKLLIQYREVTVYKIINNNNNLKNLRIVIKFKTLLNKTNFTKLVGKINL